MTRSPEISDFWKRFCEIDGVSSGGPYQVWHFGDSQAMSAELANLVVAGTKTATASLVAVNELQPETAPILHGYSVVTDLAGEPKCIIRTEEIRNVPFEEVDAEFAFDEGEGDRTLGYWRDVHHSYFSREADEHNVEFGPRSMICCERFKLLYHS